MIEKIPITYTKGSPRFEGIGLSKAELACISKINELVEKENREE